MFDIHTKEIQFGDQVIKLETGKVARQADGAVIASIGDTAVLAAVTGAKEQKEGQDFFPLSVHYIEKTYAAGKIPGGFFKREARPSEHETLTSRLIDRPIRPLFPEGFKNEVQVMCTVVSHDMQNQSDIIAMIATSAALTISGMPFMGPIGGARVGMIDGAFVLNPSKEDMANSELDLIVAGTREGVLMVESQANELDEATMLDAVMFGWKGFQPVIDGIIELAEACAKEPWELPEPAFDAKALKADISAEVAEGIKAAYAITKKQDRQEKLAELKTVATEKFVSEEDGSPITKPVVLDLFKKLEADLVRGNIIETSSRIDGRDTKTVRQIETEVGLLPRVHGSALFTRGETQAIVTTTLGTGQDEQIIDALDGEYKESFMLHYNFPPYSVGECGRVGATGRREIGHGKLAWRAIKPLLPTKEEFPYTLRLVSEITESNGSSSMATVCGASMALMHAGVPMERPVAGIAMGLIKEGDDFAVLSDILGDEDHLGDMDFKVAGSEKGITSLQMDIKITSITEEIMKIALAQAKDGRIHILGEMAKSIAATNSGVSDYAPQIVSFKINKDKIRDVIGSGGSVIREITETTGAKIDIEDDGTISVAAVDGESGRKAVDWIKGIVEEPEVGKTYEGKVVKIVDFGAFVNILPKTDGLLHISEIADHRVENVTDELQEGQDITVKCIGIDNRGKIKLSVKALNNNDEKSDEAEAS